MKKYFCVSDVHSFYDEMMLALTSAGFDETNLEHHLIICGDLFDRGTQSVECYNFVKDILQAGRLIYIRGNHEDLMKDCVEDILRGRGISRHHISNGTVRTLSHFMRCTEYDILCNVYSSIEFENVTHKLLEFIDDSTVDYFELGNTVFVHGWVPTDRTSDDDSTTCVPEDWRTGDWVHARWENGMEMAHFNILVPGKTVVCGHWHTSWGWAKKYPNQYTEWGKNSEFKTFVDNGIIAIDGCTAFTRLVNVVVFDENGNRIGETND